MFLFSFQAHADSGFSSEYFDDAKDLLNAIKKDTSRSYGFTFGISPEDVPLSLSIGIGLSKDQGTLRNFTEYAAKVMRKQAEGSSYSCDAKSPKHSVTDIALFPCPHVFPLKQ